MESRHGNDRHQLERGRDNRPRINQILLYRRSGPCLQHRRSWTVSVDKSYCGSPNLEGYGVRGAPPRIGSCGLEPNGILLLAGPDVGPGGCGLPKGD
jgi:hypothetical protein